MKGMVTPVITGPIGIKKILEATPGKHSIDSLQNAALLGTSH
jgi:hypothetical protein